MKIEKYFSSTLLPFEQDAQNKMEQLEAFFKKWSWLPFCNLKQYVLLIEELKYLFTIYKALHGYDEKLMEIGRKNKIYKI